MPDDIANYRISNCDLLLLPYRHASMSAVVFTAATFAKPIWCTRVGALEEYLNDDIAFLVENDDEKIKESLIKICNECSKEELIDMGRKLQNYIENICNWKKIAKGIVENCYNIER